MKLVFNSSTSIDIISVHPNGEGEVHVGSMGSGPGEWAMISFIVNHQPNPSGTVVLTPGSVTTRWI